MKTTLTWSTLALVLLALVAGGTALGPPPAGAQPKPVVWNLPTVAAPSYFHTVNYNALAAKVKEKSGGRMEIRIHPASSLYPSAELLPAVLDGRTELGTVLASYLTDVLFEIAKYLDYWYLAGAAMEWLVANQKAWDALPKDLQQIVLDAMKETNLEEKEWQDASDADERARKRLPELGMTVVDPPKEEIEKARKIAQGAWDIWLQRTGADGKRALELALKALGR